MTPSIYFYLPPSIYPETIPQDLNLVSGKEWMALCSKEITGYAWTLQTFLRLKANGIPCELTNMLPRKGIILAFRGNIPFNLIPQKEQLLICLMGDASPHPYAQLQVCQNPRQVELIDDSYYIPHWPMPGLIHRDSANGDRFEKIAYYGCPNNLSSELKESSWQEQLQALGLQWHIIEHQNHHDYSDVDAVIAVRSFDGREHIRKPALKLFNAWHAGVPILLPPESAYRAERKSNLDYIEVSSKEEILDALKHLQVNLEWRNAIVENGRIRALETKPEKLVERWHVFLNNVAIPMYHNWCTTSFAKRKLFLLNRFMNIRKNGIKVRLSSLVNNLQKLSKK
ncbi:glycosyltransferase family 1 protein [Synechocystis salina LEGE 06155]|nr:glycosyltransferase family 1 protein [Synechocystis salina LEGE 06155]